MMNTRLLVFTLINAALSRLLSQIIAKDVRLPNQPAANVQPLIKPEGTKMKEMLSRVGLNELSGGA
jgi:hypothetical protein